MVAPQVGHGNVTASIHGLWTIRCGLSPGVSRSAACQAANASGFRDSISPTLDGAWRCSGSFSQIQTLSGVPQ